MNRNLFFLAFFFCMFLPSFRAMGQDQVLSHFVASLEGDTLRFPIELPGVLQKELIDRGVIPDPFIGTNEEKVQWVSDRDWCLETTFELSPEELHKGYLYRLRLSRVDTFGEVYLNGALIGTTENYFRDYLFPVSDFLHPGTNRLVIRLLSPTRIAHALFLSAGINYPADNDRAEIHYSPFVRTSPYHYGWDWGPRLISMGVDSSVVLERVATVAPPVVTYSTEFSSDFSHARLIITRFAAQREDVVPECHLLLMSPEETPAAEKVLPGGRGVCRDTLHVSNPRLWWPREMGEQPLYTLTFCHSGEPKKTESYRVGFREITLEQDKDDRGESFAFRVNGRPFYAKGANYLPHDRRFRKCGDGFTLQALFEKDIVPLHINMLRVWGGGEYETEEFYHLADSLGILVWQDLPFACTTYPNDPTFRDNVSLELRDNLPRISRHPSIALLCGNNEVLEGIDHWGWKKKYGYSDEVWQKMRRDYDDFFRTFIPELVHSYAPHVDYIHGSPVSANWGKPESLLSGDSHYWGVWFGGEDFSIFDKYYGRFSSEFGFQAFPEMKTIRAFAPGVPSDSLDINHPLLVYRQRSFIGNRTITDYMQRSYRVPRHFDDYVYEGQLLQAHGMDYAIRAIRRGYPTNRGLLFWQLNDVWPAISWSSIDYYGNWKALHYKLRDALAPVATDLIRDEKGSFSLHVISDTPLPSSLTFRLVSLDFSGQKLWEKAIAFAPPRDGIHAHKVAELPGELFSHAGGQMVVRIEATSDDGTVIASRLFYPLSPKDLKLPPSSTKISATANDGVITVTITSDLLTKDLFIETPDEWQGARLSDNFFDLLPGEAKTITITHPVITPDAGIKDLRLKSLNDL